MIHIAAVDEQIPPSKDISIDVFDFLTGERWTLRDVAMSNVTFVEAKFFR